MQRASITKRENDYCSGLKALPVYLMETARQAPFFQPSLLDSFLMALTIVLLWCSSMALGPENQYHFVQPVVSVFGNFSVALRFIPRRQRR